MIGGPAEPIRPIFWNIHENYLWAEVSQYVLGSLAALLFLWGVYRHFARWRTGKPEAVLPAWPVRIRAFIQFALLQGRLVPDRYALTMHLAIFFGMCAMFIGTALATIDLDVTPASPVIAPTRSAGRIPAFFPAPINSLTLSPSDA